jgi:hypothetical protein
MWCVLEAAERFDNDTLFRTVFQQVFLFGIVVRVKLDLGR